MIEKIPTDTGFYIVSKHSPVEKVNPIEHYKANFIKTRIVILREVLIAKKPPVTNDELNQFVLQDAMKEWDKRYNEIIQTQIPKNFISLLKSQSKKEQVQLMKGQSLTPHQLTAFIFKAYMDYGFTFSTFSQEHLHNGIENEILPKLLEVKGDNVKKVGHTTLTDGQLKHLMQYRKVIVAKFVDNGENWHCLFLSFKSIKGEETWKNGQPHFHYISDKFGMTRDKVYNDLKSKYYKLNSLPHIDLIGYGDKK